MTSGTNDTVNELITRHLAGETTSAEEKELLSWLNANAENKRRYTELKKAFELAAQHLAFPVTSDLNIDVNREWDQFRQSIGERTVQRTLTPTRFWLKIAATILLLAATGAILYYFSAPATSPYRAASNMRTVTLPDGSRIELNRYSVLSLNDDFGKTTRTIKLEGEGFFRVEPDASKPFIILTDNARIQVVGTSFNVNAYDSLENIEVVVQTGIVSLASSSGDQQVKLIAGQKGVYSRAGKRIAATANNDVNFLSWSTQHIVFVAADLPSVIATLEKVYNADITIAANVSASCNVTVTFDHQSLQSVLRVLESTLGLKYTIKGNKVEITEAGC